MDDRAVEQRVTPLELFFDLVSSSPSRRSPASSPITRPGAASSAASCSSARCGGHGGAYAWLTNTLNPEEGGVRLAVFGAMAAMVVVSLATPNAFGTDGVTFGVAYFIVRALHLVLYAIAGWGDRDLLGAVLRSSALRRQRRLWGGARAEALRPRSLFGEH